MKRQTIWTLVGLLCLAVSGIICVYDCTHALQPLWHMGVCLFVLLPMAALCFDRSEKRKRNSQFIIHNSQLREAA